MAIFNFRYRWTLFWMRYADLSHFGRIATHLATWFAQPYYGRTYLSNLNTKGYIATSAIVHHNSIRFGHNVFIGDRVVIYQFKDGGPVEFDDRVKIFGDSYIQTGSGGNVQIGEKTDIHPRCQISAYKSGICIGSQVQVAPNCAFYPYNHGMKPGTSMREQPLESKGDIIVGDGAWLGYGVIVLDGARIGEGAVVGAGSVVKDDIPDGCIAVGVPARVVSRRDDIPLKDNKK